MFPIYPTGPSTLKETKHKVHRILILITFLNFYYFAHPGFISTYWIKLILSLPDALARSQSVKERLDLLKKGTHLYKVRDKGVRGLQMYKRKYWLDMENLLIHFSPHKDPSTKLGCAAIAGELLFQVRNLLYKILTISSHACPEYYNVGKYNFSLIWFYQILTQLFLYIVQDYLMDEGIKS